MFMFGSERCTTAYIPQFYGSFYIFRFYILTRVDSLLTYGQIFAIFRLVLRPFHRPITCFVQPFFLRFSHIVGVSVEINRKKLLRNKNSECGLSSLTSYIEFRKKNPPRLGKKIKDQNFYYSLKHEIFPSPKSKTL